MVVVEVRQGWLRGKTGRGWPWLRSGGGGPGDPSWPWIYILMYFWGVGCIVWPLRLPGLHCLAVKAPIVWPLRLYVRRGARHWTFDPEPIKSTFRSVSQKPFRQRKVLSEGGAKAAEPLGAYTLPFSVLLIFQRKNATNKHTVGQNAFSEFVTQMMCQKL